MLLSVLRLRFGTLRDATVCFSITTLVPRIPRLFLSSLFPMPLRVVHARRAWVTTRRFVPALARLDLVDQHREPPLRCFWLCLLFA